MVILTGRVILAKDGKPDRVGDPITHPLPRVDEIATAVDGFQGKACLQRAVSGAPAGTALLASISSREWVC